MIDHDVQIVGHAFYEKLHASALERVRAYWTEERCNAFALRLREVEPKEFTEWVCEHRHDSEWTMYATVPANQAQECGCPAIGGHFTGCPRLN